MWWSEMQALQRRAQKIIYNLLFILDANWGRSCRFVHVLHCVKKKRLKVVSICIRILCPNLMSEKTSLWIMFVSQVKMKTGISILKMVSTNWLSSLYSVISKPNCEKYLLCIHVKRSRLLNIIMFVLFEKKLSERVLLSELIL